MSEWIKVSERLPTDDMTVVWYLPEDNWYAETFRIMSPMAMCDSARKPTHWMPLPAAPEAE